MELQFTSYTIIAAIAKLFLLIFIGYSVYHLKLINDKFVDMLSLLLIRVIFPALIISKIITHFSFSEYKYWWLLPLSAIVFSLIGMLMGWIVSKFFKGFKSQKEFMCSCAFHNCAYLPMNLILFSFAGLAADKLLIYLFLFIPGFNILVWSLVPLFLSGKIKEGFKLRVLLNPPVVATLFAILWVVFMGTGSMPPVLMDPIRQLGMAAFPIAMLVLGAYLCRYKAYSPKDKGPLAASAIIKLLLFPALVLAVLRCVSIGYDYKFFLFLQSIMPTAVSLVVIGSYVDADNSFLSSSIFYTHLISIISIPLWLLAFSALVK